MPVTDPIFGLAPGFLSSSPSLRPQHPPLGPALSPREQREVAPGLFPPTPPLCPPTHTHLLPRGPAAQTLQPGLSRPPSCLGDGSLTLRLGSSLWGPQSAFFRERPALTRLGHFRPVSPPFLPPSILLPPPEPVTWAQGAATQSSGACRLSLSPTPSGCLS